MNRMPEIMMPKVLRSVLLASMVTAMVSTMITTMIAPAAATAAEPSHLMRYADIHRDWIVFTYEDDLWLVPATGGSARRITNHPGRELAAKFSPDGRYIAFTGQYDGDTDIYVMDARGGVPRRLTFHPAGDLMLGWYPDGQGILFRSRRTHPNGALEVFRIPVAGGMAERLPIDRGGLAALSPDATQLAYNRIARESRTWKRYQGGMAQDIWLADFSTGSIEKITDWEGSDNFPMWQDQYIYFTSDRADGTLNIFRHDTAGGQVQRMTPYTGYDVKYPSIGPGAIVFQNGETLHVLDLASGAIDDIQVTMPSDRVHLRPELVAVSPRSGSFGLSPAGERVLLEARGEIINLPAEKGRPINLTDDSASREKSAAWSPDGRWIAFVSDRGGEEELYLVDQKGRQEWRQLTQLGQEGGGFLLPPVWSPDSRYILFGDKFMRLNLVDVDSGALKVIDQGEFDDAWERWGILDYVWSPDSRWVAYTKNGANMNESIYLYELKSGQVTQVTDAMTTDWSPSFDPEGRYLWFLSNRTFAPIMGRQDQNHIFLNLARPYLVLLREGERSPFLAEDSEVAVADDGDDDNDKDDEDADKEDDEVETHIDLDGIARRVLVAEGVEAGNYFRLTATADGFLMLRRNEPDFSKYQNVDDGTGGELDLLGYALEDEELTTLMAGIANYHLSADGKKLIYRAGSRYGVVDSGSEAEVGDETVDLDEAKILVDRQAEFEQIFAEAWRVQRDWFYDPGMHGVDWDKIYEKYVVFVPDCGVRGDLNYLIGEMIAELNIGHTYIVGGDYEEGGARVNTGLLGCDFAVTGDADRYRIARIVPGVTWDPRYRSPLAEPGVPVQEGDYLIAIDGQPVQVGDNVFALLVNRAGEMVELTVNDRPSADDAKSFRVETLSSERALRYRAWVDANLARVQELSGGRIGYIHLPNMSYAGLVEFGRSFYPQALSEAIIVDERHNGGGFVGDMIIDRLERRLWALTVPREGGIARDPERVLHGPFAVLINEDTGSNGEYFATAIQLKGLAPIIGMRTWGGAVGIEPHQNLVDGAVTTPPQFGLYGMDGDWLIEGRGVEPDIEVQNLPASVVAGEDTQLDFAVEYLLDRLEREGEQWIIPGVPDFPDKSKAGEGRSR